MSAAHCKLLSLSCPNKQKLWPFASITFNGVGHSNSYCGKIFRNSSEHYGTHIFECPSEVGIFSFGINTRRTHFILSSCGNTKEKTSLLNRAAYS